VKQATLRSWVEDAEAEGFDMSPKGRGCLLGGAWALVSGFAFLWSLAAAYSEAEVPDDSAFWSSDLLEWVAFAIAVAGYRVAIVLTVQRSSRRWGQGMLIGLTVMLPVWVGFAILLFFSAL